MNRFETVDVAPVNLAVAECRTKQLEIPARIPALFDVVYAWLAGSGVTQVGQLLPLAGVAWEVYGDWNDDASQLVTDIYFRLA